MRIFIPPEDKGLAEDLGVIDWVYNKKKWPADRYIEAVERCRLALSTASEDAMDDPSALVYMVASYLRNDEPYQLHIKKTMKLQLGDKDEWFSKCMAAAWVVIQAYNREMTRQSKEGGEE